MLVAWLQHTIRNTLVYSVKLVKIHYEMIVKYGKKSPSDIEL